MQQLLRNGNSCSCIGSSLSSRRPLHAAAAAVLQQQPCRSSSDSLQLQPAADSRAKARSASGGDAAGGADSGGGAPVRASTQHDVKSAANAMHVKGRPCMTNSRSGRLSTCNSCRRRQVCVLVCGPMCVCVRVCAYVCVYARPMRCSLHDSDDILHWCQPTGQSHSEQVLCQGTSAGAAHAR